MKYGLNAEICDFDVFESNKKYNVIFMGDVIEHVPDPVKSMGKVYDLLKDDGVLWLSTPNFQSSFSVANGHNDPMRLEASHKNCFSKDSMYKLLERFNFTPVNYRISAHYNGSMEIICKKA